MAKFRGPVRNAADRDRLSARSRAAWERVNEAVVLARHEHLPPEEAARRAEVSMSSWRKYAPETLTRDRRGRQAVTRADRRYVGELRVISPSGVQGRAVRGSRRRSLLARHANDVRAYLETGDPAVLDKYRGRRVAGLELEVDPDVIEDLARLHHHSEVGEFWLSSDSVIPVFARARELATIMAQIPEEETAEFMRLVYTIGGMMVFPGTKVDGKMTINGARGCHPRIRDRFDLTVECIRRHYAGLSSPLSDTLKRYDGFFALFQDFAGYVEFFLLQDIVDDSASRVRFFAPFADFAASPLPRPLSVYLAYRAHAMEFLRARNERISAFARSRLTPSL